MSAVITVRSVRAQFWDQVIPIDLILDYTASAAKRIKARPVDELAPSSACLEVYRSYGPMIHYGMLLASFEPAASTDLQVRVAITEKKHHRPGWSIAPQFADVWTGTPERTVEEIVAAIQDLSDSRPLPSGIISFSVGAFARPGSPPIVFFKLARCLALYLFRQPLDFVEKELPTILEEEFG